MLLYYGASSLVTKPEYGKGNNNNDYGLGFYLTKDKYMARLWATRYVPCGYLITYDVDIKDFNILNLEDTTNENVLYWISMLIKHRFSKSDYNNNKETIDWLCNKYITNIDEYDMIIGYRADDAYFNYSKEFVQNELSLEALSLAMKVGKLGKQYVLKSPKAFNRIRMITFEKIDNTNEYAEFRKKALIEYHELKLKDDIHNTYIRDLMRKKD